MLPEEEKTVQCRQSRALNRVWSSARRSVKLTRFAWPQLGEHPQEGCLASTARSSDDEAVVSGYVDSKPWKGCCPYLLVDATEHYLRLAAGCLLQVL